MPIIDIKIKNGYKTKEVEKMQKHTKKAYKK